MQRAASRAGRVRSSVVAAGVAVAAVLASCLLAAGLLVPSAAARPFQPTGQAISGGSDPGSAVQLDTGSYVDSLARGSESASVAGSTRYYAIQVPRGQTPYVAATIAAPVGTSSSASLGLGVALTARGADTSCADDNDSAYGGSTVPVTVAVTPGAAVAAGSSGATDAAGEDRCPAGTLVVAVTRGGDAAAGAALRVELVYRLEPVAATRSLPPAAGTDPATLGADLVGPGARIESGTSYADAPLLGDGIYKDELQGNDFNVVRVHLDWGQRFAYSVDFEGRTGGSDGTLKVDAVVRNPVLELVQQGPGSDATVYGLGGDSDSLKGSTFAPVRYLNRTSTDDHVSPYRVAGDYYLVLTSTPDTKVANSVRFPYTLQLQVFGPATGSPSYAVPSGAGAGPAADGGVNRTPLAIAVAAGAAVLLIVIAVIGLRGRRRRHA